MSLTAGARDLILEKTTNLIICTTDGKTTPDDNDLANLIKFNCTYHDSITQYQPTGWPSYQIPSKWLELSEYVCT